VILSGTLMTFSFIAGAFFVFKSLLKTPLKN